MVEKWMMRKYRDKSTFKGLLEHTERPNKIEWLWLLTRNFHKEVKEILSVEYQTTVLRLYSYDILNRKYTNLCIFMHFFSLVSRFVTAFFFCNG